MWRDKIENTDIDAEEKLEHSKMMGLMGKTHYDHASKQARVSGRW